MGVKFWQELRQGRHTEEMAQSDLLDAAKSYATNPTTTNTLHLFESARQLVATEARNKT